MASWGYKYTSEDWSSPLHSSIRRYYRFRLGGPVKPWEKLTEAGIHLVIISGAWAQLSDQGTSDRQEATHRLKDTELAMAF